MKKFLTLIILLTASMFSAKALEKSGYTDLTDLYQRATIYQYHLKDYESAIKDYSRMAELS